MSFQSPNNAACLVITADDSFVPRLSLVNSASRGNCVGKLQGDLVNSEVSFREKNFGIYVYVETSLRVFRVATCLLESSP